MMRLERVLRRHLDGLEQSALRRRNAVQAEYDDPKITVHKRRYLGVPYALAIEAHGRLRYLRQVLPEYPELPDLFAWFVRWHIDATELELVILYELFVRNGIVRFQAALAHERDFEALPRVEAVARPELLVADSDPAIEIPSMERSAGGRPPVEIDYQKLAFYLFARGKVSRNEARDKIDLKRVAHEKHLDAARIILAEIARLARASREGG